MVVDAAQSQAGRASISKGAPNHGERGVPSPRTCRKPANGCCAHREGIWRQQQVGRRDAKRSTSILELDGDNASFSVACKSLKRDMRTLPDS